MREVSAQGIKLIKHWEGCRLQSYQDEAGKWTIGWGSRFRGNYPYSISSLQAEQYLREDLRRIAAALNQMILRDVEQWEFDALGSWCFNVGENAAANSTLIRKLNMQEPARIVAAEFLRWNKVTLEDGTKIPKIGLTARRQSERTLFLTGRLQFF